MDCLQVHNFNIENPHKNLLKSIFYYQISIINLFSLFHMNKWTGQYNLV